MAPPKSSPQTVQEAKSGDANAFEDLVKATYRSSFALAYRLVGNKDDALDILQDAYLRAFRSLKSFRGEASFETWMFRIVSNCAYTFRARRGRRSREQSFGGAEIAELPGGISIQEPVYDTGATEIESALKRLPRRLLSVVVLRDIYGFSHLEIAERLEITEATAKVRLHRGRKRLLDLYFSGKRSTDEIEAVVEDGFVVTKAS